MDVNEMLDENSLTQRKFTARSTGAAFSDACIASQLIGIAVIFLITWATLGLLLAEIDQSVVVFILERAMYSAQLILIFVVLGYMILHGASLSEMGVRGTRFSSFFFAMIFGLGTIIVVVPIGNLFIGWLEGLGYYIPADAGEGELLPFDLTFFIADLIIVSVLPAVFEELLMRGIVLNGAKQCGTFFAVISNGILFSLFHQDPLQTAHPFMIGCVLALITLRCNSILPAMLLHFLNNAYYVVSSYFDLSVPEAYYQIVLMAGIVMFFVGLFYFLFIDRKYKYKKQISATPFLRGALPGIVFCTVVWLLVFLTNNVYFFPQIAE